MAGWGYRETQHLSFWDPRDPVPLALTLPLRGAVQGPILCLLPISVLLSVGESLVPRFQKQGLWVVWWSCRPHCPDGSTLSNTGRGKPWCPQRPQPHWEQVWRQRWAGTPAYSQPWPVATACFWSCCWALWVASHRVHASSSKMGSRAQPY